MSILKFFFIHRRKFLPALAGVFLFLFLLTHLNDFAEIFHDYRFQKQGFEIKNLLDKKLNYAIQQRDDIISSRVFDVFAEERNSFQVLVVAQNEAQKRNLDFIVVTDNSGFVLARSHMPSQRGDNVFVTVPAARKIAEGQKVAGIFRGGRSPLAIVAGSPIVKDNKIIGAVILGYVINDEYAGKLKKQLPFAQTELAFYSQENGIVGTTFMDNAIRQSLNAHLSPGSDFILNASEIKKNLKIGGEGYFVRNIALQDNGRSSAGLLVFYPLSHSFISGIFAAVMAVLFFLILFFGFISKEPVDRGELQIIFGILSVGLFLAAFGAGLYKLGQSVTGLKKSFYAIYNSTLKLEPESDVIQQFVEKTIAVKVLTGGETINAVKAVIGYDPSAVKVLDIVMADSLCNKDFLIEKSIDNKTGRAIVACGVPNPGFSKSSGTVAELIIRPIALGSFSLKFIDDDMQVLANDGLGTNVLRTATDAFLQVIKPEFAVKKITDPLPVFSPSHPNNNRWYGERDILLLWPSAGKNTNYYYALNKESSYKFGNNDKPVKELGTNFSVVEDGVYFFHIKAENEKGKSGPVSHFKLMIDSTPPEPPTILISEQSVKKGEIVIIDLASQDETSGLQPGFFVKINDGEGLFLPVKPPFYLPLVESGDFTVTARVFDKADNFSESSIILRADD